jgi:putative transposase
MDLHLGRQESDSAGDNAGDSRNGYSKKAVLTENQEAAAQIPRDRSGTFEPRIIPKYQKRGPPPNGQIVSTHGFGMAGRDIKARLEKIYGVEAPPDLVSRAAEGVGEEARERRNRSLEKPHAVMRLDAIRVKAGEEGKGRAKSGRAALGVNFEGRAEALGLWMAEGGGPRFGWVR